MKLIEVLVQVYETSGIRTPLAVLRRVILLEKNLRFASCRVFADGLLISDVVNDVGNTKAVRLMEASPTVA